MGNSSNNKELNKRKALDWKNEVEKKRSNNPYYKKLPESISINKSDNEDIELGDTLKLIFEYYNSNICDLYKYDKGNMKKFIKALQKLSSTPRQDFKSIIKNTISFNGSYKELFNTLPGDIDSLHEIEIDDAKRAFFFLKDEYCCLVTVKSSHY